MILSSRRPHISIVVVHFRGGDDALTCLRSCADLSLDKEVIVVDNEGDSTSLVPSSVPSDVKLLPMDRNRGYGTAANRGFRVATGKHVLLLNQDSVINERALLQMIEVADESGAWVVGPRLGDGTGEVAPEKARFPYPLAPPTGLARTSRWHEVPWISGAVMLFAENRSDLRFDERFFMYVEDEELCYRVWRGGGTVALADAACVVHVGETASAAQWSRSQILMRTHSNRFRMVRWHMGLKGAAAYGRWVLTNRVFDAGRS